MNNLNIKLVSENYIKENTTILENVENTFIKNNIILVQDMYLQDILGSRLYDDIITQFENYKTDFDAGITGITYDDYVDEKYLTLIKNFIQPLLKFYVLYSSVYDIYSKFTNKSIVTQNSENSTVVSEKYIENLKLDFLNKAEFYAKRLSNYLLDNVSIYDLYDEGGALNSDILPNTQQYKTNGWYLKSKTSRCRNINPNIF